jgi:hypothetical protein
LQLENQSIRRCARQLAGLLGPAILSVAASFPLFGAIPTEQPATTFVTLALRLNSLEGHGDEVDSYFGPESLRPPPNEAPMKLSSLVAEADALLERIEQEQQIAPTARGARQLAQVSSFAALLEIIEQPRHWSFAREALNVYRMPMPVIDPAATRRTLTALSAALPRGSNASLSQRLTDFLAHFVVPPERRQAVFKRALSECRTRTLAHWKLPPDEQLDVEWTSSVSAAWHRYRGHDRSTLQINPDALALIGSAIDIACHEAYPGHHTQYLALEQNAGAAGLGVEDRIVLLRSPVSVLREGAANFGVEIAFPLEERIAFDRDVLFPLAGLDPTQAQRYDTVHRLIDELASAAVPILAAYRDRRLTFGEAASKLVTDAQISSPASLLQFTDKYGAYVLGYTAARDQIRKYVTEQALRTGESDWSVLRRVVAEPAAQQWPTQVLQTVRHR